MSEAEKPGVPLDDLPEALIAPRRAVSLVWLIPIVALLIGGDVDLLLGEVDDIARLVEEVERSGADPWSATLSVPGSARVRSLRGRHPAGRAWRVAEAIELLRNALNQ